MNKTISPFAILMMITWGLFSACQKEEKVEIPKNFPVELSAERWEVRANTRLFTDNAEIMDPAQVQAYVDREGLEELFEGSDELLEELPIIHFESENLGRFTTTADQRHFKMERKGTRFIFYSLDHYAVNPMAPPSDHSLGYFHNMLRYSDALSQPNAQGERQTRTVWVGHGNFKVLKMSALAYVLKAQQDAADPGSLWQGAGVLPNEFDEKSIKYLKVGDTLAVKEYAIIYSLVN